MDYLKPNEVLHAMLAAGSAKARLSLRDLLIRGFLSGALLGTATTFALTATLQTNTPLVGALVFPVGFVIIILLGLELVTGSFALVPLAAIDGRITWGEALVNLAWVFLGNLAGSVAYGGLLYLVLTNCGTAPVAAAGIGPKLIALAEAKTNAYAALGSAGWLTAFVKGILCNWLVCLGVVLAFTSQSAVGKIVAGWIPILIFFAQGFEHSVVNMFVIPTGMMLGAKTTAQTWWLWNQVPVTLGNLFGGMVLTGLLLYWTYPARTGESSVSPAAMTPGRISGLQAAMK